MYSKLREATEEEISELDTSYILIRQHQKIDQQETNKKTK